MYALEAEPEGSSRWRRLGVGSGLSILLAVTLGIAAQRIQPVARALATVVPMTVIDEPELAKPDVPPPPPPPPAPVKPPSRPKSVPTQAPPDAPPLPPTTEPPPAEQVGLDPDSFGTGSGGPAFGVGTTQMGAPSSAGVAPPPPPPQPKPKLVEARARNEQELLVYPEWARRKKLEGVIVIEADIDARGRVTRAIVRETLDPRLDALVQNALLAAVFEPAKLGGRAVSSTKLVRVRFQLR